jgi:hypothetical protein
VTRCDRHDDLVNVFESQRVAQTALFSCWWWQIENGHLTRTGLLALRSRLDPVSGEFIVGPDVEQLRALVDQALGADVAQIPDDLSELDDPGADRRDW